MDINIIFKLAGLGILASMVNIVLKKSDKEEIGTIVTLTALVIGLMLVLDMIAGLFDSIRSIFRLY